MAWVVSHSPQWRVPRHRQHEASRPQGGREAPPLQVSSSQGPAKARSERVNQGLTTPPSIQVLFEKTLPGAFLSKSVTANQ